MNKNSTFGIGLSLAAMLVFTAPAMAGPNTVYFEPLPEEIKKTPLHRRNVYLRSDNHHGKLKYVCVKSDILVTEIPEDAPNCDQHTRRRYTHHAHSAQNNQTYHPTYGEIICALWGGRSGEARCTIGYSIPPITSGFIDRQALAIRCVSPLFIPDATGGGTDSKVTHFF